MPDSSDYIREQAVALLTAIEYLPSFTRDGMGSFGRIMEMIGMTLQYVARGEQERAHAIIHEFSQKVSGMFKDPTEAFVIQRAFADFALVLDVPANDMAH